MRKIVKMFEQGNVSVSGLRGSGKDLLFGNVIMRRKMRYISNTDYGGDRLPLNLMDFDCGRNTFENFISGDLYPYVYPYDDDVDVYVGDAGIYFPAQYNGELTKKYPYLANYFALSRQLGECNMHVNSQSLNRVWDKIREQCDQYITCKGVIKPLVRFGIVIQYVIIYENYDAAVKRVPPFRLKRPLLNADRRFQWEMARQNYEVAHGQITPRILIYRNKSRHDTRVFKEILANGTKKHEAKK